MNFQTMCHLMLFLSWSRGMIIVGLVGAVTPNLSDFVFLALGLIAYFHVTPYFGFRLFDFKRINDKNDFIPLKRWMVPNGNVELSGYEYEILLKEKNSLLKYIFNIR